MSNMNEFALPRTATYTRNILKNVYVWMTIALTITGVTAFGLSQNTEFVESLFTSGLYWVFWIGQLAMIFVLSSLIWKLKPMVATILFAAYSVLMGFSLSLVFYRFELGSIATVFFITAGTFAAMSVYGLTTKRDLSSWGTYLMMGVIGVFIASIVNVFIGWDVLSFIISIVGVVVFTALTAYDTQKIKKMSDSFGENLNEADYMRLSIQGALSLYIDFINIFLFLLRLLGARR